MNKACDWIETHADDLFPLFSEQFNKYRLSSKNTENTRSFKVKSLDGYQTRDDFCDWLIQFV